MHCKNFYFIKGNSPFYAWNLLKKARKLKAVHYIVSLMLPVTATRMVLFK